METKLYLSVHLMVLYKGLCFFVFFYCFHKKPTMGDKNSNYRKMLKDCFLDTDDAMESKLFINKSYELLH